MHRSGILIVTAAATVLNGIAQADVVIGYGVAELSAFGTALPTAQSSVSVNWPGPIGPLGVRVPPVGTQNVTRVDLSDFTNDGFSLTAAGAGRWSALVGFRFSVDAPTLAVLSGQVFGDSGLNLLSGVALEDGDAGITLFAFDTPGSNFDSGSLTLQPGVQYSLVYQSNYGLGGGTGQGSLLNLALTVVPEPQAVATACLAGVLLSRRRTQRPELV